MSSIFAHIRLIYLLYLFYGAAFLYLGASIAAKDMKGSELKLADSLWFLAAFAFLHGAREWMQLGQLIEGKELSLQQQLVGQSVGLTLVVSSFLFLLQFGVRLLQRLGDRRTRWLNALPVPLIFAWALAVWFYGPRGDWLSVGGAMLRVAETASRYLLGFTGAALTGYALIAYCREVRVLSPPASRQLAHAGVAFLFYSLFSGIITTRYFLPVLPIPVELFRGFCALFIAFFIVRALNIFDIEARRKIELQTRLLVQAEKLTSLGQLAAGIAHEINNPLTNASLGIQTLKRSLGRTPGGGGTIEKLDAVERNIDRASAIAQELLQFSRQQELDFTPLDLNAVIQGGLTLLAYKLKPVQVVLKLTPVPEVLGDPGKLQQVVINVVSNAVEAMSDGGKVTIGTRVEKGQVVAVFGDTGNGIAADDLNRVFDPFFTTKEIGSGTGLGLSICYGIIRQHRGTIEMYSEAGKGTEVTVRLPAGGG